MRLAEFITSNATAIIAEWEVFARSCVPAANAMDLGQRRDHVAGMLKAIARDLDTPQTTAEQTAKGKGLIDEHVSSDTAANAHGTDRAAIGYTPEQMVSEFRALRASVLRLWSEAQSEFNRANVEEMTRFNEAIDQLLAESIVRYSHEVARSKDLFLGVLGHDLRNPLGAILMSATMMLQKEGPDWPHKRSVAQIIKSGMRIDGMIGDLVDFTRTRLGNGIPVARNDHDLEAICRHAVDEAAAFHANSVVRFEASGDLSGEWDGGRLGQALSNLIGNAFQHGASGEPVDVGARGDGDEVIVTVHNIGPTIPKGADIFSPFRQLEPTHRKSKAAQSLGLGLYIASAIAVAHEGSLAVESAANHTTFTMRLPRHPSVP